MSAFKHASKLRLSLAAWMLGVLAACGGGGGGGGGGNAGGGSGGAASVAANAANSSATNPLAAFTAISGIPLVTVADPPHVNFTVINKDGHVVQGLTLNGAAVTDPQTNSTVTCNNVSFAIAKLVRDPLGVIPDQWVNYIYRTQFPGVGSDADVGSGPGNKAVFGVSAGTPSTDPHLKQATTDPITSAALSFNNTGFYTYSFTTDIRTPTAANNNVAFEPSLTHRVAIQLCFVDSDGTIVRVNPYYDFTLVADPSVANGYMSKPVTNPANTHVVVDKASCNECHNKLAAHGGARVDPQFCVMCHNPGTTDPNSGNLLDFRTMVHKIHAGRRLAAATDGAPENYTIWGDQDVLSDFSNVGYPQDLRNCTKCHDGSVGAVHRTPQGDNWKLHPSHFACLTCHKSDPTSPWYAVHIPAFFPSLAAVSDGPCKACHVDLNLGVDAAHAHFNQIEADAARYQFNFDAQPAYDSGTRMVTLKYSITDPSNSNAAYDLKADCSGACTGTNKFGNVRIVIGSLTLVGAPASIADFTSSNATNVFAYTGTDDGTHHYTVTTPALPNTGAAQSHGTARALNYGQVIEPELDPITRAVVPGATVNVSLRNQFNDFSLDGTGTPRRTVVSDAKCEACHGRLGTASGSNTLANAFHSGGRNSVAACPICHDVNRLSTDEVSTSGIAYNESFQFKRMIHGIHSAGVTSFRENDFIHGNATALGGNNHNYSLEVKYPGILADCDTCHVNDSHLHDAGALGTTVHTNTTIKTADNLSDPLFNNVISPKASSCSGCHDGVAAMSHMVTVGGAVFGTSPTSVCGAVPGSLCGSVSGMLAAGGSANVDWSGGPTQADILANKVFEACDGCHAPGAIEGVDAVHAHGTANTN